MDPDGIDIGSVTDEDVCCLDGRPFVAGPQQGRPGGDVSCCVRRTSFQQQTACVGASTSGCQDGKLHHQPRIKLGEMAFSQSTSFLLYFLKLVTNLTGIMERSALFIVFSVHIRTSLQSSKGQKFKMTLN